MMIAQLPHWRAQLSIIVRLANGRVLPERIVSRDDLYTQPIGFWLSLWRRLRREGTIPLTMAFAAFLTWMLESQCGVRAPIMYAILTNAGSAYLTQNFAGLGGANLSNFVFHGTGTNNTAATVAQTDLIAALSQARVTAANSNPIAGSVLSVATQSYSSTLMIQEWGLFSAAGAGSPPVGGTLWDRRVVSPAQGVNNGDQVTYNYNGTMPSGGT